MNAGTGADASAASRGSRRLPTYLFVLPWSLAHVGGVNQVVVNLAREMRRAGAFEPAVLVNDWSARRPVWGEVHGVPTVQWRLPGVPTGSGWKSNAASWLWQRHFERAFADFCRVHLVAVINVHYPESWALPLQRQVRRFDPAMRLLLSFHGADLNALTTAAPEVIAAWRVALRLAAAVVVCSGDMQARMRAVFGADLACHVVHNGLDAAAFVESAGQVDGDPAALERRAVLNVAKFEPKKGQDVLIAAFARLAKDDADLTLVLVGAGASALPALQSACHRAGINHRVEFHVDVPHDGVAAFFRRACVFVLPSRQEPFGIVLLEAAAFGLPVVATRVGGIPEIVTDGVTGRLVAADDPAALAGAIRSVLDAPDAARAMGERLRRDAASRFTWAAAGERYRLLAGEVHRTGTGARHESGQIDRLVESR